MAERRMFAKSVIDSDDFLDMPEGAQLLYFHLAMRADDDGFITPKKVMRMIGARDDSMKILIAKKFILPFDSGVIVIRHWRVNNYLRGDRYKETEYKAEKEQLCISGSLPYEISTGIPEVDQRYTNGLPEVNPGKDSIGKDSIEKDSIGYISSDNLGAVLPSNTDIGDKKDEASLDTNGLSDVNPDKPSIPKVPCEKIKDLYNTVCTSLPRCTLISEKRKKAINAILGQFSMEQVTEAFKKVQASDFLSGRSGAWQCSFDWLMITGNMLKVIEGNYDNKKNSRSDLGEREFTLTSREAKLSTDREFVLR